MVPIFKRLVNINLCSQLFSHRASQILGTAVLHGITPIRAAIILLYSIRIGFGTKISNSRRRVYYYNNIYLPSTYVYNIEVRRRTIFRRRFDRGSISIINPH